MNVNILVFRGSLQNEGNIWALEFDNEIFLMSCGYDNPVVVKNSFDIDYLREKKENIKCIFLLNSSPKNSAFLETIYHELDLSNVKIYGTVITKEALKCFYNLDSRILENFFEINNKQEEIMISKKVKAGFSLVDSYYIGTMGLRIYNEEHCIYYLEDFSFNVLNNNNVLFDPMFFMQKMRKFFSLRRKRTCLVSSCQNLSLSNNGSLSSEFKKIFSREKKVFLMVYDFDFIHILEAFEIAQKLNIVVNVLDEKMFSFLSKVLSSGPFSKIIRNQKNQDKFGIHLLTVNFNEIVNKVSKFIEKRKDQIFVYCLFPMSGSEERTAKLADFLHSFDNDFFDLSRNENLTIGTNFYDLKIILKTLNPNIFVLLQNSYKNSGLLDQIRSFKPRIIPNLHFLNISISSKKISTSLIKSHKKFISTENLLSLQREKLLKNGLIVILLRASWKGEKLDLNYIKTFSLSVSDTIDFLKLEKKIKQWWETKIDEDRLYNHLNQNVKQVLERRLSGLVRNYLSFENDVEIEEPLFLTFLEEKSENLKKSRV